MNGEFDGIHDLKHQRVAKALAQVNGFRYRYQPAPQLNSEMLRFDSDDDEDCINVNETSNDQASSNENERQNYLKPGTKQVDGGLDVPLLTFDDHIDHLLRKTRTLAMLKIVNNTVDLVSSDSEDDSEEAGDIVTKELSLICLTKLGSRTNGSSSGKLLDVGDGRSSLVGTAAVKLARTVSAFLCLPRAISYVELEAITERLLEINNGFDDDEYANLIDYHVNSARGYETISATAEDDTIWKRRVLRPIQPLKLVEDLTDLELHQRHMFREANRFGGVSSRSFFLASSNLLLSSNDPEGTERPLESAALGSSTIMSAEVGLPPGISSEEVATSPFDEEQYIKWRTTVKDDYLAWLNAKVEAQKRRKSRTKKDDTNKKPRWLLLYEASKSKD